MSVFIGDWHALLILLIAGVIPNQIWRMLGLMVGGESTKARNCWSG